MICLLSPLWNLQPTAQPCEKTGQKYLFWFLPLLVCGLFDSEENLAGEVEWADAASKISYIIFITHMEPFSEGASQAFGCSHVIQSLLRSVFKPMQGHELSHIGCKLKMNPGSEISATCFKFAITDSMIHTFWDCSTGLVWYRTLVIRVIRVILDFKTISLPVRGYSEVSLELDYSFPFSDGW